MKNFNPDKTILGVIILFVSSLMSFTVYAIDNPDSTDITTEFKIRAKPYEQLMSRLSKAQQQELKKSQKNWIKFRDTEFKFITNNWTRSHFGSSAYLSRGQYKSKIIKTRILQLLNYTQNY